MNSVCHRSCKFHNKLQTISVCKSKAQWSEKKVLSHTILLLSVSASVHVCVWYMAVASPMSQNTCGDGHSGFNPQPNYSLALWFMRTLRQPRAHFLKHHRPITLRLITLQSRILQSLSCVSHQSPTDLCSLNTQLSAARSHVSSSPQAKKKKIHVPWGN